MAASSAPGGSLRRAAWAKVNLTLHVTGRRSDGYHELDSLIVFAGVGDEVEVAPADDLTLDVGGPFAAALAADDTRSGNLVLRAAAALRARFAVRAGAGLRLIKNLPVAAGVGGGSADAAAALKALDALWDLGAAPSELAALGAALGADMPVCLIGRPSFVGGIGERIEPAPALPPAWLVLANPGVPLATARVFAERAGPFSAPRRRPGALRDAGALAEWLARGGNDLEAPARRLVPEIADLLASLSASPDCLLARMSGSGATCFGLYAERTAAERAARAVTAAHPVWWVKAAPILSAGEGETD